MFPNLTELTHRLDNVFKFVCGQLVELVKGQAQSNADVAKIRGALIAEYGEFVDDPNAGITRRKMIQPPMVWEKTVTQQTVVETKHPQGKRLIYGGFYANLGDNPFKVRLICPGGESPEHTVPPGVSIPITSVVQQVVILPLDGQPATYQIYGR